jgi:hypothetical protein
MEEDGGALSIVNRQLKEFRVESNYLERKVGRGISLAMADIPVPPVVCAAKDSQAFQDEGFAGETLLGQDCYGPLNFFALIRLQPL